MNSSTAEKGFVLPVAMGVGLIAILLGVIVVARSSQNRITATAQRETARSLAAAETGITQFQSLFDRARPLATFCSTGTVCVTTPTWQTATNANLAPKGICNPAAAAEVQGYAISQWKYVDDDNPTKTLEQKERDGQFRLHSYAFTNAPAGTQLGTGTLIVEGRVNAEGGTESYRTSTTRIKVEFNVNDGRLTAGQLPGLWVQNDGASSAEPTVVLNTNIRNSACTPNTTQVSQLTALAPSAYRYEASAGEPFPTLPQQGRSTADFGTPTSSLPGNIINDSTGVLPIAPGANIARYRVSSINLSGTSTLTVGNVSQPATYLVYVEGDINISAGSVSAVNVASGSKLIIYAHGTVSLTGNSSVLPIAQDGTSSPENAQIYVYSATPSGPAVSISNNTGAPIDLFLFAPQSQVTMAGGARVRGMIWANSWVGTGGAQIIQSSIDAMMLDQIGFLPRISPVTSWQRQSGS
ncbi:MAG: hypothetical protein MH252_16040 [Thermosynechococcaceae cyanobacterium MS004]|nr:hypothetical protein [Thermosynechococcaceae cyanobacterium MS004]